MEWFTPQPSTEQSALAFHPSLHAQRPVLTLHVPWPEHAGPSSPLRLPGQDKFKGGCTNSSQTYRPFRLHAWTSHFGPLHPVPTSQTHSIKSSRCPRPLQGSADALPATLLTSAGTVFFGPRRSSAISARRYLAQVVFAPLPVAAATYSTTEGPIGMH